MKHKEQCRGSCMKVGDSKKRGEEFSEIGEFQWISINL
jgi:hypothetical protein